VYFSRYLFSFLLFTGLTLNVFSKGPINTLLYTYSFKNLFYIMYGIFLSTVCDNLCEDSRKIDFKMVALETLNCFHLAH
jgi:hypothetical protein